MSLVRRSLQALSSKKLKPQLPASSPFPPNVVGQPSSDVIRREFRHLLTTKADGTPLPAPVEVVVTTRLERTSGEYLIGDLVYTLSLLPGEEVRMFSTDRRTRFSVDTATKIGYHASASFEDHMYMSAMDSFVGKMSSNQWAQVDSNTSGSFNTHAETSGLCESIFGTPSADMSGSFNTHSVTDFVSGMSAQASAAHNVSATATNTASAVSVGAIGIRSSIEGKLDTHVEMNYRSFRNPSRTRAVTFYFFQIRRMHTVRFWVDSVAVSAPERTMWRLTRAASTAVNATPQALAMASGGLEAIGAAQLPDPNRYKDFRDAHKIVTNELMERQLLAPQGSSGHAMPDVVRTQTTFSQEFSLPTPGLFVRGGRDIADVSDPSLLRQVAGVGSVIADELEGLAVNVVERLGSGIVPAVMNTVVAAQALLSGATASLP